MVESISHIGNIEYFAMGNKLGKGIILLKQLSALSSKIIH